MTLKPSLPRLDQPFLHLVGDRLRRADEGEPAIAAERAGRAGARSGSRARPARPARSRPLLLALVSGISGSGPSGSKPRGVVAERDRQRGDARCRSAPGCRAVRASPSPPRRCRRPRRRRRAGSSRWSGLRPSFSIAALHVGIEAAAVGEIAAAGEHHLGGLGGELPAGVGGAGLHDHRPALDRPGDVERPAHLTDTCPCGSAHAACAGSK